MNEENVNINKKTLTIGKTYTIFVTIYGIGRVQKRKIKFNGQSDEIGFHSGKKFG